MANYYLAKDEEDNNPSLLYPAPPPPSSPPSRPKIVWKTKHNTPPQQSIRNGVPPYPPTIVFGGGKPLDNDDDAATASTDLDISYQGTGAGGDWSSFHNNYESPLLIRQIRGSGSFNIDTYNITSRSPSPRKNLSPLLCEDERNMDDDGDKDEDEDSFLPSQHQKEVEDRRDENSVPYRHSPRCSSNKPPTSERGSLSPSSTSLMHQWQFHSDNDDSGHDYDAEFQGATTTTTATEYAPPSIVQEQEHERSEEYYQRRLQQLEDTNAQQLQRLQDNALVLATLQRQLSEANRQIEVFEFAWNEKHQHESNGNNNSSGNLDVDILGDRYFQLEAELEQYRLENASLRQQQKQQRMEEEARRRRTASPTSAAVAAASSLFSFSSFSPKEQSPSLLCPSPATITPPLVALPSKVSNFPFSHHESSSTTQSGDASPTVNNNNYDGSNKQEENEESLISKLRSKNATLRSRLEDKFSKVGSAATKESTRAREAQSDIDVDQLVRTNADLRKEVENLHSKQATHAQETKRLREGYELRLESEAVHYKALEMKHTKLRSQLEGLLGERWTWTTREEDSNATIATLRFEKSQLLQELEEETQAVQASQQETLEAKKKCARWEDELKQLRDQLEDQRAESVRAATEAMAQKTQLLRDLNSLSTCKGQLQEQMTKLQQRHNSKIQDLENKWIERCTEAEKRYIASSQAEQEESKVELKRLRSRNESLSVKLEQHLKRSEDELQRRIAEQERTHHRAQEQCKAVHASQMEKSVAENGRLKAELADCRANYSVLQNQRDKIEQQHQDCITEMHSTVFGIYF